MLDSNGKTGDTRSDAANGSALASQVQAVARIQTDLLCRKCGANLYGQEVRKLDETDLLVTQCPRCAAFASAEEAMPYRRIWQQKIGLAVMLCWMAALCLLAALVVNFEADLTSRTLGRRSRWVANPPPPGSPGVESRFMFSRGVWEFDWSTTRDRLPLAIPAAAVTTLLAGGFCACAVYHWRRRWLVLAAIGAPLVALFMFYWDVMNSTQRQWLTGSALCAAVGLTACQIAGGVVGVFVGRPLARVLLGVLLPGRARQHFAFLWRRDGKMMPVLGPQHEVGA